MFDFFHKHKNNTVTKINPQVTTNPQTNTNTQQQYVQTNIQAQSSGQVPIQNQANFQANGSSAGTNPTVIQASNQNYPQAQSNSQKVVVNPNSVVQSKPQSQPVVVDPNAQTRAFNDEEVEMVEMINNLVVAILGYSPADIPEQNREKIVKECVKIFSDYMIKFVELKYGQQDATRLRASQKFGDGSVFIKFGELGPKFEDAYNSFLESLDKRWDKMATST